MLAYPIAYILARSKMKHKAVVLMVFVMPMWINFTLRITALKEILTVVEGNLAYHPFLNTLIGMTYDFLPFMILPIYTTLLKLDNSLLEAAADLGADTIQTFFKGNITAVRSGDYQWYCYGISTIYDQLCCVGHALQ